MDYPLSVRETEVTIGIAAIAEHGDLVLLGTDMRATFPKLATAHDECAKAYWIDRKSVV